jgi:hypothetical protein
VGRAGRWDFKWKVKRGQIRINSWGRRGCAVEVWAWVVGVSAGVQVGVALDSFLYSTHCNGSRVWL